MLSSRSKLLKSQCFIVTIQRDGQMEYANMCENVIARKNPAMILCVLARNYADRYDIVYVFLWLLPKPIQNKLLYYIISRAEMA